MTDGQGIDIRLIDIIPVTPRDRSIFEPIDRNFDGARETNGGPALVWWGSQLVPRRLTKILRGTVSMKFPKLIIR